MVLQNKEFLAAVFHDMLAEVMYQIRNRGRLAVLVLGGENEGVAALVREEHLKASAGNKCDGTGLAASWLFHAAE
jgi:hypothetical protein